MFTAAVALDIIACVPAVADFKVIGPAQFAFALNNAVTITVLPAWKL
jgi:hypothetical protein